uniref:ATP synthase complex subunit 8 n=1 Tax=Torleya nepalica TaxID=1566145 RepID=A0A7D6FUR9_9INSE|nr:ATP synthase F0 subunit 8 [Torleya nepalica]QLP89024.1 ATP synthase F0 subunit 8 [Torleya nepalica]
MPQMAPLSWILLFFFFTLIYVLFNILNYFSFNTSASTQEGKSNQTQHSLTWKW